mmetsp:Transcript_42206/g.76147  ORF Transcript_42206/g.76147 Transcript_42206/m.76147 type:complete len:296 (+) Transcript_42206:830-1717(+)
MLELLLKHPLVFRAHPNPQIRPREGTRRIKALGIPSIPTFLRLGGHTFGRIVSAWVLIVGRRFCQLIELLVWKCLSVSMLQHWEMPGRRALGVEFLARSRRRAGRMTMMIAKSNTTSRNVLILWWWDAVPMLHSTTTATATISILWWTIVPILKVFSSVATKVTTSAVSPIVSSIVLIATVITPIISKSPMMVAILRPVKLLIAAPSVAKLTTSSAVVSPVVSSIVIIATVVTLIITKPPMVAILRHRKLLIVALLMVVPASMTIGMIVTIASILPTMTMMAVIPTKMTITRATA